MNVTVINLEGEPTGPQRIARRFAAERARVESFNRHMIYAMMPHRTELWNSTPFKVRP